MRKNISKKRAPSGSKREKLKSARGEKSSARAAKKRTWWAADQETRRRVSKYVVGERAVVKYVADDLAESRTVSRALWEPAKQVTEVFSERGDAHRWLYVGMERRPGAHKVWSVYLRCACGARRTVVAESWDEADRVKGEAGKRLECAACGRDLRGSETSRIQFKADGIGCVPYCDSVGCL